MITDSGWTLPGSAFLPTIHALEAIGTNVFAATDGGVYLSTNNGTSWTPINEGLPKPTYDSTQPIPVWCLAIGATDLFAGTYDGGVCKRPLAQMITSAQPLATVSPQGFCLEQNYPNPFNPKTGIRVQGSGNRDMRLVVYDLLGREVAVLANGKYPAGEHTFTFDGTNLASGVYMYRLTAGAFSAVRRMLLVR
ncbi:MAG TPA: T9SS type A sorting domain-containing protein [Bacteroidota bacterium]|nr:T9SS type A sorting domain-containing protein [Bacteroidota bacterium]